MLPHRLRLGIPKAVTGHFFKSIFSPDVFFLIIVILMQ